MRTVFDKSGLSVVHWRVSLPESIGKGSMCRVLTQQALQHRFRLLLGVCPQCVLLN